MHTHINIMCTCKPINRYINRERYISIDIYTYLYAYTYTSISLVKKDKLGRATKRRSAWFQTGLKAGILLSRSRALPILWFHILPKTGIPTGALGPRNGVYSVWYRDLYSCGLSKNANVIRGIFEVSDGAIILVAIEASTVIVILFWAYGEVYGFDSVS